MFPPHYLRSSPIAALGGGGAAVGSLDSYTTGMTGAYSVSRKLLTAYAGDFYTVTGSGVSTLNDQSGNTRDFTQGTDSRRPPIVSASGRDAMDFALANQHTLVSAATLDDFINNNAGYMVASFIVDVFTLNQATVAQNDWVLADAGLFAGIVVKNAGGGQTWSYNFDGTYDAGGTTITTATAYVVEWLHTGGNVTNRVNSGTSNTVASGNTSTMTNAMRIGSASASQAFDGKIWEIAMWDTVPSSPDRDAIVSALMSWVGAV